MTTSGTSQLVAGVVVAGAALLALARWKRWLTAEATPVAIGVGLAVVLGTGAGGGLLLLVFLSSTSVLTRFRYGGMAHDGREHASIPRGREARQVWANGGTAASCALLCVLPGLGVLGAGVAGALAAALADSWATEIGTAIRGRTVLITSFREVRPGTSGGVSVAGTLAGLAGSSLAGGLVALAPSLWVAPWGLRGSAPWPGHNPAITAGLAVALGGVAGMLLDSVLGATVEGRRPWLDNEAVNLAATLAGAAVAVLAA